MTATWKQLLTKKQDQLQSQGSEGRIPQSWVDGSSCAASANYTKHSWLIASDANMNPEDFRKSSWHKGRHMFIDAPGEGVSYPKAREREKGGVKEGRELRKGGRGTR